MDSEPNRHLFIYGTLLIPEIWEAVTQFPEAESAPAQLSHHIIRRVIDADFPAIAQVEDSNSTVSGRIVYDLSTDCFDRLDRYEDTFYTRDRVIVVTPSRSVAAETYRVDPTEASHWLSETPWTLEWFQANALEAYMRRVFG